MRKGSWTELALGRTAGVGGSDESQIAGSGPHQGPSTQGPKEVPPDGDARNAQGQRGHGTPGGDTHFRAQRGQCVVGAGRRGRRREYVEGSGLRGAGGVGEQRRRNREEKARD